jgi:lipopolysaccharide transport system ATP-binding protein
VEHRFDDIVEWAGLAEFIDMPVKHYSSGMYLRLAFSVAVNLEPDILLADEVLAVGDLAFQERCIQRVQEAGAAGRTVIFVSHDLAAITRLCQRVIWLDRGRIAAIGEPREVVSRYERSAWDARTGGQDGEADPERDSQGQVVATRLLSSGGQAVGAIRASDELEVEVTFRTSAVGARARCVFDVYSDNVLAFTSKQRPAMDIPRPGLYAARVRIPGDLLAEALYTVKLEVGIGRAGTEHFLPGARAVSFRVYEPSGGAPGNRNNRARVGVVAPRLEWQASAEGVLVGS